MFPPLFLLSSAVSVGGQLMAGMGAAKTAAFNAQQSSFGGAINAFNIKTEREIAQAEATAKAVDRINDLNNNLSVNLALFSKTGRDVQNDRSVKAFLEKQRETAAEDVTRIGTMNQLTGNKLMADAIAAQAEGTVRAANIMAEGKAQMRSAVVGAFTTTIGAIHKYNQIRV